MYDFNIAVSAGDAFNVNCLNMSWKRRAERAYHHGNLREALIQAARELIKEKGPAGFTFADAARSAGVSAAAPYRHFRDREALLADVAREGFQRFEAMLSTGWANGKPDALTAFNNVGRAYLAFARAEPAYYAAMFESGLPPDLNADLRAAADRAFAVLRTAADSLVAMLPVGKRPPAMMMSLHVWSMAHGIASLFGRGDAGRRTLPMTAEELLESVMLIYLQGLGFPQKS
jgi:AcrR family transcriptional regulator